MDEEKPKLGARELELKRELDARKKVRELEQRRQKAVQTAVEGRHKYYDKLRDTLLASLPDDLRSLMEAEIAASEEVETLSDAEVTEV